VISMHGEASSKSYNGEGEEESLTGGDFCVKCPKFG
jgi:hypothetical protein